MKNTLKYIIFILIGVSTSCSKSGDDGLHDGGILSPKGSYWPYAVGNSWHLVNTEDAEDVTEYFIHKTLTHEGKTYFQFKPIGLEEDLELVNGVREDDGVFYELHGTVPQAGVTVSPGTITSIDTKANVGELWKDEMTLQVSGQATGTIKHTNEGKILEKVATVQINGKNYKDVLKAETKKTVVNSISGLHLTITFETWLAKGVGIIFEKTTYSDSEITSSGLVKYSLK